MKRAAKLRLVVAAAALGALTAIAGGGAASASPAAKAKAVVITAEKDGKNLLFEGPKTVERGQVLKFKSNTDPRKVGPHTFSLASRKTLPDTPKEIKECARDFAGICGAAIEWHEVDLEGGDVGKKVVDAGKAGWDREGNLKRKGDSVVVEREGGSFKQKVSAAKGKTLHFFCAVHPEMQGKIKVKG